jgi:hypothetical protein
VPLHVVIAVRLDLLTKSSWLVMVVPIAQIVLHFVRDVVTVHIEMMCVV